jgi:1-acyl-sn-glycerol-3-phosphate acyltransferase
MIWALLRSLLWTDPLIFAATAVMASLSLAASLVDGTGRRQQRIARRWARMILRICGATVTVRGRENLRPGATYVFCANHLSLIDTPLVFGYLDWDFRILARKGLFQIPFLGWHLRRAGHMPVALDDVRAAVRNVTDAARRVAQGVSVVIFPEAGRSLDGRMGEFKAGGPFIAIKAGVAVVPMGILGTREVHTMGSPIVRRGAVELRIGEPISTEGLSTRDADLLLLRMRDRIAELVLPGGVPAR